MNMHEIPQRIQNDIKFASDYKSKGQLIRIIQMQRGEDPCFATDKRYACNQICEWGKECRKLVAQWQR